MSKISVLMVCLGNICRSPMAEAVFRYHVLNAGLADVIEVDSAGTASYHVGEKAHPRTLETLAKRDIPHQGRARQFVAHDFQRFQYVWAMDRENLMYIQRLAPPTSQKGQAALFLSEAFAQGLTDTDEVPDPYYTGEYERVYALVEAGSKAWLARLRKEGSL